MYYEHFRLSGEPFSLTPDPAFLFLGEKHREAMAAVQYGLQNGRGFITLIGEVGTGKTTILYSVLSQLGPEVVAAYVPYAAHSFDDLLRAALKDLGEKPRTRASRLDLLEILQQMLVRRDAEGQRTALVIDEAQSLADSTFEELRLLSNFETYTHKLLQIVLVGQPELQTRLRQQNLRQLQQRVSVRAIINPLDASEMEAYIHHRLKRAGGDERLFEPPALRLIVRHARGIPRRANILCHSALLFAFGRSLPVVTVNAAREAIAEMEERDPGWLGRGTLKRSPGSRKWSWMRPLGFAGAVTVALVAGAILLGGAGSGSTDPTPATAAAETPTAAVARAPHDTAAQPVPPAPAEPVEVAAVAPSPTPEAVPTGAQPAVAGKADPDSAGAPAGTSDAPTEAAVRTVSIPPGGSILAAARDLYGDVEGEVEIRALLGEVRRLNPGLRDVNLVKAGAVVRFPGLPGRSESDGQHPE